jgi:outer membrane protein TolC
LEAIAISKLSLDEVFDNVRKSYPSIQAAEKDRDAAQFEIQSNEGAFDIQWKTKSEFSILGYYQNQFVDSIIEKPTQIWGSTFYLGYRAGLGNFPVYYGNYATNTQGEARFGLSLPLWRNGPIDRRRANLQQSKIKFDSSQNEIQQVKLDSLKSAGIRFWDWVLAGKKVEVYRNLLKIAVERDAALNSRVKHGDLPEFEKKDNERSIFQRRSQLIQSERIFQNLSFELFLFTRKQSLETADLSKVIDLLPEIPLPADPPSFEIEKLFSVAQKNRPDLRKIEYEMQRISNEKSFFDNQLNPKIDLFFETSQELGPYDSARSPTELRSGLQIEIPLERNTAKGKKEALSSQTQSLEIKYKFLQDKIRNELRDTYNSILTSIERYKAVSEEVSLTFRLEKDERTRFKQGDSNILFINLREQASADVSIRLYEIQAEYQKAMISYQASLGILD